MTRVLFVCLGNICRSPMAEGVFRRLVEDRGLSERFEIDSAGTIGTHAGELADPRTRAVLRKHGVELDCRSRRLRPDDGERFDWIFVMDESNLADARHILGSDDKLRLVMEPAGGGEVPDPYYGGRDGFDRVYDMLTGVLDHWLDEMVDGR